MDIDDRFIFEIQHNIAFLPKQERQITLEGMFKFEVTDFLTLKNSHFCFFQFLDTFLMLEYSYSRTGFYVLLFSDNILKMAKML